MLREPGRWSMPEPEARTGSVRTPSASSPRTSSCIGRSPWRRIGSAQHALRAAGRVLHHAHRRRVERLLRQPVERLAVADGEPERKLDILAEMMELRPGMRIMDVGCGWGGPLTYLSTKYGVQGRGPDLSLSQKAAAEERIARHGADVEIVVSHWKDYVADEPFDAIYTDEVIVHFFDLGDFFKKVHGLLRDGGRMLNKELHW